jgi:hypothetical protein
MLRAMPLTPFLIGFFGFAILCLLIAFGHAGGARRHWRARRRFAAGHRALWSLVFVLLALVGALAGMAILGYRRLTAEARIATIETRELAPTRYAVDIDLPDGSRRSAEIEGEEWQLDARVIKWDPRAVVLGAPVLYRLDRVSGRWRDAAKEAETPKSVVALSSPSAIDLWQVKHALSQGLPWIDADYGSGAYLPLIDGGRFDVTLAAGGGLVARPADAATAGKIRAMKW